jgi:hypothetical protein
VSAAWYEIWVSERLDPHWSQWFESLEIDPIPAGSSQAGTILRGCLPDQAALFGVLSQVRNLNLTLIEVRRIKPAENEQHPPVGSQSPLKQGD